MALDSLYGAILKLKAPYAFYQVLLKLYTEKKRKDKVSRIIQEMNAYAGISLVSGRFGDDNRDWFVNKEKKQISQDLSSIGYMSQLAAEDLYRISQQKSFIRQEDLNAKDQYNAEKQSEYDLKCKANPKKKYANPKLVDFNMTESRMFVDLLRTLHRDTCLNSKQVKVLIMLRYFEEFGRTKKLAQLADAYYKAFNSNDPSAFTVFKKMDELRELENSLLDEDFNIAELAAAENEYLGLCISRYSQAMDNEYLVLDVEANYGHKLRLYSLARGTTGTLKAAKNVKGIHNVAKNDCIAIQNWGKRNKCSYKNGERKILKDQFELWIYDMKIVYHNTEKKKDTAA